MVPSIDLLVIVVLAAWMIRLSELIRYKGTIDKDIYDASLINAYLSFGAFTYIALWILIHIAALFR